MRAQLGRLLDSNDLEKLFATIVQADKFLITSCSEYAYCLMGYEFGDLNDLLDMNSLGHRLTNFLNEHIFQLDCRGDGRGCNGSTGRGWGDWDALTLILGEARATIAEETAWNIDTFCIVWARLDTGTALIHISRTSSTHARWGDPILGAVAEGVALGIDGTNLLDRITGLVIAWT